MARAGRSGIASRVQVPVGSSYLCKMSSDERFLKLPGASSGLKLFGGRVKGRNVAGPSCFSLTRFCGHFCGHFCGVCSSYDSKHEEALSLHVFEIGLPPLINNSTIHIKELKEAGWTVRNPLAPSQRETRTQGRQDDQPKPLPR